MLNALYQKLHTQLLRPGILKTKHHKSYTSSQINRTQSAYLDNVHNGHGGVGEAMDKHGFQQTFSVVARVTDTSIPAINAHK